MIFVMKERERERGIDRAEKEEKKEKISS